MSCNKIICKYCNIEIFDVYDNNIDQPEFGLFIHKK
jgi:Ni,Fe-hydrogenase III small subunit